VERATRQRPQRTSDGAKDEGSIKLVNTVRDGVATIGAFHLGPSGLSAPLDGRGGGGDRKKR
jgi:hypothetical protein